MRNAAKQKRTVAEVAIAMPDDRAALAAAIENKRKADDAVMAQEQAISRAQELVDQAEAAIEKARAKIPDAKSADISRASTSIIREQKIVSPWSTDKANAAVRHAVEHHELMENALKRLQADLLKLEDDQADAANEVSIQVKLVTQPLAQHLYEQTLALKKKLAMNQRVLAQLLDDDDRRAPKFHSSLRSIRAADRRQAPFKELRELAQSLMFTSDDAHVAAGEAASRWKDALVSLESNPAAPLPPID